MEKYVDETINCENRSFKCHRLALTIASDYFDCMFNGEFNESVMSTVNLPNIDAAIFEEVIRFVYTGDAKINSSNIYDLLLIAIS